MGHTPNMADVILVHGAGTGGWLWDDVAALLRAEGHRVLTPTLPGSAHRRLQRIATSVCRPYRCVVGLRGTNSSTG